MRKAFVVVWLSVLVAGCNKKAATDAAEHDTGTKPVEAATERSADDLPLSVLFVKLDGVDLTLREREPDGPALTGAAGVKRSLGEAGAKVISEESGADWFVLAPSLQPVEPPSPSPSPAGADSAARPSGPSVEGKRTHFQTHWMDNLSVVVPPGFSFSVDGSGVPGYRVTSKNLEVVISDAEDKEPSFAATRQHLQQRFASFGDVRVEREAETASGFSMIVGYGNGAARRYAVAMRSCVD
jgi:hypothetical protein